MSTLQSPAGEKIPTFKQFVQESRRAAAARHGVSVAEVSRELPESAFLARWRDMVVKEFGLGGEITARLWASMDAGLQWRVLRSTRALCDDGLTARLRGFAGTHPQAQ